tara:strand:- start:1143 stop:1544 length:402 start_codon:yes stop_codon:yes gene_type:complete
MRGAPTEAVIERPVTSTILAETVVGEPSPDCNPKPSTEILLSQVSVTEPRLELIENPFTDTLALACMVGVPSAEVIPVIVGTFTMDAATIWIEPNPDVVACPVTLTLAAPVTVSELLSAEVIDCPVGVTSALA